MEEYQMDWDMNVIPLTNFYNMQKSKATGTALINVILPRQPSSASDFERLSGTLIDMDGDTPPIALL